HRHPQSACPRRQSRARKQRRPPMNRLHRPPAPGHALNGHADQEHAHDHIAHYEVETDAPPPLSDADLRHLGEYEKKTQLVRDRVVGVARGRSTGLYLWGPGGTGKSYAVTGTLKELGANYRLHNSRMDGRGLFTAIERSPDAVHVLEDCEQMMRNRNV